ncbi:MAG: hypothetical protein JWP94_3843 [Mucilaginibacter sp.]|jgi:hypothetical protein|nr:hypothetical protein [Mucilaginibacter sp.]
MHLKMQYYIFLRDFAYTWVADALFFYCFYNIDLPAGDYLG